MSINYLLGRLVQKITGRTCRRCRHNCADHCAHPSDRMYMECWHSITRPGFEERPGKYLRQDTKLTAQEQHEMEKIKAALQQAEDKARESGLLEDLSRGKE